MIGLCKIFVGNIAEGMANFGSINFAVYLQVIEGKEKPPVRVLLKNLPTILRVMLTASSRIPALVIQILENPHGDLKGHQIGLGHMHLGRRYKIKKKRPRASASDRGKAHLVPIRSNPDPCACRCGSRGAGAVAQITAMLNSKCAFMLLAAWLLASCTSAPSLYRVTELVPGISTQADAIAKLGPPTATSKIGEQTVLQWADANLPIHLAISFGMDGRMIQVASDATGVDQLSATRR
jgi:hypothetical protein